MPLSHSPYLPLAAVGFGAISVGFGLNAIVRPMEALSVFEFAPPASAEDRQLVQILSAVYGFKDVFVGACFFSFSQALSCGLAPISFALADPSSWTVARARAGASIAITAYFARGNRPALGWTLVAASACAVADGFACKLVAGRGQWNHWSYAWLPLALGGALLGVVG